MAKQYSRLLHLPNTKNVFLFGARNTGKSTYIKGKFEESSRILINLLRPSVEARFKQNPDELYQIVTSLPKETTHVLIDEIQKLPKLLDVVQDLMGDTDKYFIMTGSSARKLKKGGANLLAGRAFVYNMFPLTHIELGEDFKLSEVLHWGSLPEIYQCDTDIEKKDFLFSYAHTYLKEEIWEEHEVKDLDPFRRFMEVAAQANGKPVNYSKIARDVGVSDNTAKAYFSILEDTLIGFFLESYHGSFRKRLSQQPKFYLFDTGITRALAYLSEVNLVEKTNAYGNAFEHFIVLECIRLANYHRLDYRFSYIRTHDGAEIDLIVERPGKPLLCIEIKSSKIINKADISMFVNLSKDIKNSISICICDDEFPKQIEHVEVLPWRTALLRYFTRQE